jgi:hypothetical protein
MTRRELRDAVYRNLNPRKRGPEIVVILLPPSPPESEHFSQCACVQLSSVNYIHTKYPCVRVCVWALQIRIYKFIQFYIALGGIKILYDRPYMIYSSCPVFLFPKWCDREQAKMLPIRLKQYSIGTTSAYIGIRIKRHLCVCVYYVHVSNASYIYIYIFFFQRVVSPNGRKKNNKISSLAK